MRTAAAKTDHLQLLEEALKREGDRIDPVHASLLLALPFYPGLDMRESLMEVDRLAARARARLGRAHTPHRVISAINGALFDDAGFRGNTKDYYDPRNSFLNEVLKRKTGIPIALSAVYVGIAARLKQPIVGVGMPLHFIVKYVGERHEFYIDPFNRGEVLTADQCRKRVQEAYGAPVKLETNLLDETPVRAMLFRMLNNLKLAFLKEDDFQRAGIVVEQMLIVKPGRPEMIRDRGLLYVQERKWAAAAEWLERYLRRCGEAPDASDAQRQLQIAVDRRARRN